VAAKISKEQARYEANPFLEQELKRSTMFVPALTKVAEALVVKCQEAAPYEEGDFRDGFEVAGVVTEAEGVAVRMTNTDWKAAIIEFGTSEYPFSAPIRRGIEAAGFKLEDDK